MSGIGGAWGELPVLQTPGQQAAAQQNYQTPAQAATTALAQIDQVPIAAGDTAGQVVTGAGNILTDLENAMSNLFGTAGQYVLIGGAILALIALSDNERTRRR